MQYRLGIDIGGTFTDFTILGSDGSVVLWKEDSTPDDQLRAIVTGLSNVAEHMGMSIDELLDSSTSLVHGSTIATNTLIQRDAPPAALLCTRGFRDILLLRDGFKPNRFNVHMERPADFVDRYLTFGISERIDSQGHIVQDLNEDDVRAAAEKIKAAGVKAVGIAFMWSVSNPVHEERAAAILAEALPDVAVLISSEVLPEIREWERTSATALSAYIWPKIGDYLNRFEAMLKATPFARELQIMQINGGCASVPEVMRRPVYTLASGPAAAPAAALFHMTEPELGNVITGDMGGTSFDVCLITGGRPAMSRSVQVEFQPIGVAAVEVNSIGAGGGSIGWIDDGGALRVGPQSAGSKPGPVCYDQGGEQPTVTDANVALGYLSPTAFLGGRRELRRDLSIKALEDFLGGKLGLDGIQAAAGMLEVVDANMVAGIRAVSVERGIDPRGYTFVAGGGAGGLHATRLARKLQMQQVLVPREMSTLCAFGMTVTDTRHDYVWSQFGKAEDIDLSELSTTFSLTEERARGRLKAAGFSEDDIVIERYVDSRYTNQIHELMVPAPRGELREKELSEIVGRFHDQHLQQFTYNILDAPVEFLHWRLTAIGRSQQESAALTEPELIGEAAAEKAFLGYQDAYSFSTKKLEATPIFDADALTVGAQLDGPAILQGPTTTILLNTGDHLTVTPKNQFMIQLGV
jgi:N-methylhydantoinase A